MIFAMPPEASVSEFHGFLSAHASLLESVYHRSKAAGWSVTSEEFAAALYRSATHHFGSAPPASGAAESYFHALHLEDLALVCALRRGSEAAWGKFVAEYRPVLQASARAIVGAGGESRAHELADSLFAELYGVDRSGGARKNSLLDYFHGRSKLATWLRSVLAQRYVDTLRASQRLDSLDDEQTAARAAGRERAAGSSESIDPDRARLLPRLAEAIPEALAALPPSDRLLLSLYYVQGLTLAQIARTRGVHEATASRRLQNIRGELREHIESVLARGRAARNGRPAAKGLSPAEIRRCLDYALEDWPFDLSSALAEDAVPGRTEGK
jgi:RNA polymerase sigma-70 factor (ECF subfamily)